METEIGGSTFKGCVSVNAQTGAVARTFNQQICYNDDAGSCDHDNDPATANAADTPSSWDGGLGCETPQSPLVLCTTNAECGTTDVVCAAAQTGGCGSTTGQCS